MSQSCRLSMQFLLCRLTYRRHPTTAWDGVLLLLSQGMHVSNPLLGLEIIAPLLPVHQHPAGVAMPLTVLLLDERHDQLLGVYGCFLS